jgi:Ca2+/Na+ antiporter
MENFNEIKSIWENGHTDSIISNITIDDVIKQHIRKKRNKNINNMILLFLMLVTLVLLIGFASFQMWTTYFGLSIFLMVTCYLIYLRRNGRSKISDLELLDNNEFLSTLKEEKNKTCVGNTKQQTNLFILYAIGFGFYIYETASKSITSLLIGYGVLAIYLLAAKFFYFPLIAQRNQRKTDEIIKQINALQNQYDEKKI